jgi:hypothetical protein
MGTMRSATWAAGTRLRPRDGARRSSHLEPLNGVDSSFITLDGA